MSDVIEDRLRSAADAAVGADSLSDPRTVADASTSSVRQWHRPLLVAGALVLLVAGVGWLLVGRDDVVRTVDRSTTAPPPTTSTTSTSVPDGGGTTVAPLTSTPPSTTPATTQTTTPRPTTPRPASTAPAPSANLPPGPSAQLFGAASATWGDAPFSAETAAATDGHVVQRMTWSAAGLETVPVDPPGATTLQGRQQMVQGPGGAIVLTISEPSLTQGMSQLPLFAQECVREAGGRFEVWPVPGGGAGSCATQPGPADRVVTVRLDAAGRISRATSTFRGEPVVTTFSYL